jgi:hypothetical protein
MQCPFSLRGEENPLFVETHQFSLGITLVCPLTFFNEAKGYENKMASRATCCPFSSF